MRYQLGLNSTLQEVFVGDGLGDDIVSTVIVKRVKSKLSVSAYGGQSDKMDIVIPGEDDRLDLNGFMYIGGHPNPPPQYPGFHRVRFVGCMSQAIFNKVDFVKEVMENDESVKQENIKKTYNPAIPPRSMNFNKNTMLRFKIQFQDPLDTTKILQKFYGSLEFRTVLLEGTILTASSVSLRFQRSQLSLISGGDIVSIDFPNEGQANDGRWFRVEYIVENNNLELRLNDVRNQIVPSHNPQYGAFVTFGLFNNPNFIGCIRNLVLQGVKITYYDINYPYRESPIADKVVDLSEGCKASDPCIPNPCFHNGLCLTVVQDPGVLCDCRQNYKPPFCQFCK